MILPVLKPNYTLHGHKLRLFTLRKAQFVTGGIIFYLTKKHTHQPPPPFGHLPQMQQINADCIMSFQVAFGEEW